MLQEEPEVARAFLRATERGYRFAAEQPEVAADILLQYNPDLEKEFADASQRYLSKQYLSEDGEWGRMEEKLWRNFGDFLLEYGLLNESFDPSAAYTNKFLP
jgi:ABC-type nitrate/sulfonate/bicarbonate transport system substrate-binding protein